MKTYLIPLILLLVANVSFAQYASVYGKVIDEKTGEDLIYANLLLEKDSVFAAGGTTDFEGNYSITIDPGIYNLKIKYTGYEDQVISEILVKEGQGTKLDIKMHIAEYQTETVVAGDGYKVPLINAISAEQTSNKEEIRNIPPRNISALAATTAGLSQEEEDQPFKENRRTTDYYVDGIRVKGNLIPQSEIEVLSDKHNLSKKQLKKISILPLISVKPAQTDEPETSDYFADGILHINLAQDAKFLNIYDAKGQLINHIKITAPGKQSIDLSALPASTYAIGFKQGKKTIMKRLVIPNGE